MRTIITLLIFFIAYSLTSAQVKCCFEGGINLSSVSYSGMLNDEPGGQRTGGILGISFEFYTSKEFSLQTGVRCIQKGCTFTNKVAEITQRVDYLELPFVANLKILTGSFEPSISGGFFYSARISASQVQKYNTGEYYEYDLNDLYDDSDFGALMGAGLEYKFTKWFSIFSSANYSFGFINTLADNPVGSASNKGLQLLTGLKIAL